MNQDKVWKQGQEYWNSTMTSLSHGARDLWANPRITMIRIEVLVSLVAAALFFLAIFGSQRRRSRNGFLQKGVFMAFTLSFSMATYILGSMQSSGVKSSMYPIWAISLIMLHGCTDSITAYSVDDNRQLATLTYQAYNYWAYALLLLISVRTAYTLQLLFMACIAFFRYAQRLAACILVSNSRNWNKIVADYMYEEKNKGAFDTMEDCRYLVDWPISKSKFDAPTYATQLTADHAEDGVIDLGKIWKCKEESLGPELKDTCLSFSLFHLLRSRYFGFVCDEYKVGAHNFVFKMLLKEEKKDCQVDDNRVLLEEEKKDCQVDYKRVFKVIEVELAFMYDFFFTKYAVIYYGSIAATIWSFISAISMFVMAYITAMAPVKITQGDSVVAGSITYDIVITIVILASIGLLEFLQLLLYWMGIWGRVSFVCQSIREEGRSNRTGTRGSRLIMRLNKFLASIGMSCAPYQHYWQHKIGQYSLLDSVGSSPKRSFFQILGLSRFVVITMKMVYLSDYAFSHPLNNQALAARNKAEKSVELPDEVKEALIRSLKDNGSKLSNGESSLKSNEAYHHLLWACEWEMHPDQGWSQRKQNQTHIILTWHIATWYCEKVPLSPDGSEELKAHLSIATKLSKYCAYLVVSAPKLLPGHHYDTVRKFDAAVAEAVLVLQSATSMYEGMKSLTVPQEQRSSVTNSIFESGVKLGKQLQAMEDVGKRWRVMANFWAEMMLYLAPSDNVNEHIEQLAKGGELITHLWALLSHAGIVKREQEQEHQAGDLEAGAGASGWRPTPSASSCILET